MSVNKIENKSQFISNEPVAGIAKASGLDSVIAHLAKEILPCIKEIIIGPSIEEATANIVIRARFAEKGRLASMQLRNPMDCAADLIDIERAGFTNDTPVGINGSGRIIPLSAGDSNNALTAQLLIAIIEKTYGTDMAQRMTRRYRLDGKVPLTLGEFKRVLIGLAANVRVSDLDLIFKKIKDDDGTHVLVNELKKYNPQMITRLRKEMENPTSVDYAFALEMLRLVRLDGAAKSVDQVLFRDQEEAKKAYGFNQGLYEYFVEWMDYKAVFHSGAWDQLRTHIEGLPDSYNLALAEFFGKTLAYDELRQGMVFTIPNKGPNGNPSTYSLADSLALCGDAVHGYFFKEDHVPAGEVQNVFLAFRGTAFSPQMLDSEASLYRDGSLHQIGKMEFEKREKEILFRLERYLSEQPTDHVVLNITGHSLGGADAQRALVLIAEALAHSAVNSPLRKIKKINCTPHNSPGLEAALNERFTKAMRKIAETPELKENLEIELNYLMHWFKLDGDYVQDLVQQVGDVFVGANINDSENLRRRVYNVYNDHLEVDNMYTAKGVETTFEAHSQRVFNPVMHPGSPNIELVDEKNQKERIETILNRQLETHYQLEQPQRLIKWLTEAKWPLEILNSKLHTFALLLNQVRQFIEPALDHRFS